MESEVNPRINISAIAVAVACMAILCAFAALPGLVAANQDKSPFLPAFKLVAAALAGLAITIVYRRQLRDKPSSLIAEHAQIVLCVAGALMTIVVGDSLSRALAMVGGASIIRFRTPVKDPRNATILFALLGLGAACGLGAYSVAAAGTIFFCLLLTIMEVAGRYDAPQTSLHEAGPRLVDLGPDIKSVVWKIPMKDGGACGR